MYWKKEKEQEIDSLRIIVKGLLVDNNFPVDEQGRLVHKISEKVWQHQQHTKEDEKEKLLDDARTGVEDDLKKIEQFFLSKYACGKGKKEQIKGKIRNAALKRILAICREEFELCFDLHNFDKSVKEFLQFNPLSHPWEERENALIHEIQNMLDDHQPRTSTNWKVDILSDIFLKCNLWTNYRDPYQAMRKRFRKINQKKLSQS
jgi:hypothetical protein